jgi:diketogulonate reductase-like aldo/keto reductase
VQAAFNAYGVSATDSDPLQKAIEILSAQLAAQQLEINQLKTK